MKKDSSKEMKRPRPAGRLMTKNEEKLLYWLLRAYIGFNRAGWEEGPTGNEVFTEINRVLANHGVCGHRDEGCDFVTRSATERLLRKYDRKEWKKKATEAVRDRGQTT